MSKDQDHSGGSASKPSRPKPAGRGGRRPHNAKRTGEWNTLDELVAFVGKEPRQVMLNGKTVTMSRAERRLRDEVDRALKGEVRALKLIVQLMIKFPKVVSSTRMEIHRFINGPIADV
jgi:hypothetical protein